MTACRNVSKRRLLPRQQQKNDHISSHRKCKHGRSSHAKVGVTVAECSTAEAANSTATAAEEVAVISSNNGRCKCGICTSVARGKTMGCKFTVVKVEQKIK